MLAVAARRVEPGELSRFLPPEDGSGPGPDEANTITTAIPEGEAITTD